MAARLKVTQIKSVISEKQNQRDTLRSLGLKRIGDTVVREDSPANRGYVRAVAHLVNEVAQLTFTSDPILRHDLATAAPRGHDREDQRRDQQRQPSAVRDLSEVRAQEGELGSAEYERHQGQDAAFAVIVRTHHEDAVLDRDRDDQRPNHE